MSAPDTLIIDLGKDFCPTPLGRYRRQGRYSGEAFREDHLRPALLRYQTVIVDLDNATGLSTGFLDESFAGLIRDRTLTEAAFAERIEVRATKDAFLIDEVVNYVRKAAQSVGQH